ncbi:MAG: DUF5060 domain-containing protein [Chloroflexi bacterium]|nr:DUF5060 domain-containing protein [Chloroflexota bacterium]
MQSPRCETSVERWGLYELRLQGPTHGNPFTEVRFGASFTLGHRAVDVDGFYDGDGVYCVRFLPDTEGTWACTTRSDAASLDGHTASFRCSVPSAGNHGPVRVAHTYHFQYEDGTPYRQIGTTCYAWVHQGPGLEEQTLATLRTAPFNKLRMCVFPKHYRYNENEPELFPFARQADGSWDWDRFDPAFWRHLEGRVADLLSLGIEADLILFHPYDRWGFATMDAETDDRYLRYAVARLAAYRNVWWSMANEYDLMTAKSTADWDRFFRIVQQADPYHHPRSIHNCRGFYDHSKPWVTHASVQHWDLSRALEWREAYGKPVINDECQYEGNIPNQWGNIPARELVHRFWLGTVGGMYVGHGETYLHPDEILWWSKGGVLHGESPARLAFLRQVLEEGPVEGLEPQGRRVAGQAGRYYLHYTGVHQPAEWSFELPEGQHYRAELLDPWEMTVTPLADDLSGEFTVRLPGKPYQAVRLLRI